MSIVINFLKGVISTVFVMIGCFLVTFYMKEPFSIVSLFCGLLGFFILYPAVDKWKETLKFRKNRSK
jgi:hypothetical protein